ncbi:hypothetical protein YC2023_096183 [Brassica napus]
MWRILVSFLKFASFIDEMFQPVSKFLNRRDILFLQTTVWSIVAYVCILRSNISFTLACICCPIFYLVPFCFILIIFEPSISSTIANIFANHQHHYMFLISIVEVLIALVITHAKALISVQEGSLLLEIIVVSVYYIIITICELLRIKDRGSINGTATVIILVMEKRFKVLAVVPITAVLVFLKSILSADCCVQCRARKLTDKETEEDNRNRFVKALTSGEYPGRWAAYDSSPN